MCLTPAIPVAMVNLHLLLIFTRMGWASVSMRGASDKRRSKHAISLPRPPKTATLPAQTSSVPLISHVTPKHTNTPADQMALKPRQERGATLQNIPPY